MENIDSVIGKYIIFFDEDPSTMEFLYEEDEVKAIL